MTDNVMTDEESSEIRGSLFNLDEDNQWCEKGICQVSTRYDEESKETFLQLNAESDGSLLLESKIKMDTDYIKQEGRFLIWTEDDTVVGLSFQESNGCDDIWELICQIQGKDPTDEIDQDIIVKAEQDIVEEPEDIVEEVWFEEMLDIERAQLTSYERDVLEQLIELVNNLVSPAPEEKITPLAEIELLDLCDTLEGFEKPEELQQLHETILYLLSLNRENQ